MADIHNVCIASSTTRGVQVKVEHNLHRNIWEMGVVHRKNVPRKHPTFLRALYEKGYYIPIPTAINIDNYIIMRSLVLMVGP